MLLIIDNYDSFTYNLVQYYQQLGQEVKVVRNDQITLAQISELAPKYLVISPGPCDPGAAGISLAAIKHFAGQLPIFGVCLGHQAIAQAFGGNVVLAHEVMHGKTSLIEHRNNGVFKQLPNPLRVTRYHSLVVEPETLPECFEVTATIEGKAGIEIMAMRHQTLPIESVQFHPESILTEQGLGILANFIEQYE
ncbi:aminodeoxychorismate/anthranilate synthase component II [Psychrobium sp. 1_MG-2023]|uniref:anthranilate synthase component II n=1 Tax=Psychrobium sp. 1_MG-2023 TaxID=3062624 RepID=UPI000C3308DD|nr:aminodeoxychorismate/anthranilate synthase component II [Psychrobium sp. 1_MG-2023]MDP2560828.1 aminodeoxychorismate/anthranilate synthase component II [Psychrobium sp. 1_MG-2023]PKF56702.1 anthranilate/aminodeoxychorismate synthase component II [Alteromonadales bacterium alter-6D02]